MRDWVELKESAEKISDPSVMLRNRGTEDQRIREWKNDQRTKTAIRVTSKRGSRLLSGFKADDTAIPEYQEIHSEGSGHDLRTSPRLASM